MGRNRRWDLLPRHLPNCMITKTSGAKGAGISCVDASPRISDCTISNNYSGNGIDCRDHSAPRITNCTIDGHSADLGAGIASRDSRPTITNCKIPITRANGKAGGIHCYHSWAMIENCIISNNRAIDGGGGGIEVYERPPYPSEVTLKNCTDTNNEGSESEQGGGLLDNHGTTVVTNCIIGYNIPDQTGGSFPPAMTFSNVIRETLWPGEGNIHADPMFRSYRGFDYVLQPGSPCMDTGTGANDGIPWSRVSPGYGRHNRQAPDMGAYGGPGAWGG